MPESCVLMALSVPYGEWDVVPHDADGGSIVFPTRAAAERAAVEIRAETPDWYAELLVVPVAEMVTQRV